MTTAGSQTGESGRRCALVIGNSDYVRAAPLANASNDAAEVGRALKRIGWDVTVRENLSRSAMEDALEAFRVKTDGASAALFFFAGHGTNIWGQNYLLPVDARIEVEDPVQQRSFYLGNILEGMVERAGVSIALIDACQENPFQRSTTRSISNGRHGAGLAYIKAPQGAFVAFAASPGELAYDTPGRHSPFTSALLESLESGDNEITDIFLQVKERVQRATGGAQRPWMHSELAQPFYLSARQAELPKVTAKVRTVEAKRTPPPNTGPFVTAKVRVPAAEQETAAETQPARASETARAAHGAGAPVAVPADIGSIGEVASQLALALGAAEWERLRNSRDIGQLTRFAEHFPGYYGELAKERAQQLSGEMREHSNWLWASQHDSVDAYQRFLAVWPQGRYSAIAYGRLQELEGAEKRPSRGALGAVKPPHTKTEMKPAPVNARAEPQPRSEQRSRPEPATEQMPETPPDGAVGGGYRAGQVIRDLEIAPELVVVPAGAFIMGSSEENAHPSELPEHRVVIPRPLAVGRYPVTFIEWDAAFEAGGVIQQPTDKRWGRGRRPVINVSWNDAQAYVDWLSEETGHQYRLLTEAEWEYCCRAGTKTAYSTGSHLVRRAAHCSFDHWGCAGKTIEVGSFDPNRFGLFDMHGNVAEWVEDTWSDTYSEAPGDGSAYVGDRQSPKVVRGGGWPDIPRSLRSSSRNRLKATARNDHTGFRVARVLDIKPAAGASRPDIGRR